MASPAQAAASRTRWHAPDLARDIDAGAYLETILVAAVTSVLLTRLYLQATGFPQLGNGPLHIAHLLWGGLLMLISLIVLLASLGKRIKHASAAVGGLGFGLFVDEIGKFVTSDNNYFFQPAVALIYLIMVALFLVFRAIDKRLPTSTEYLVNAADQVREVVLDGATRAEVARGLDLLARSGASGPLAEHIRALLESAVCEPENAPNRVHRLTNWAWRLYDRLLAWSWFQRAVLVLFVGQALFGLAGVLVVGVSGAFQLRMSVDALSIASSLVSLLFVAIGVLYLPRARIRAYHWFERSLLVAIMITQVLLFWQDQLAALGGLFWNLGLLTVVRSMIALEAARGSSRYSAT